MSTQAGYQDPALAAGQSGARWAYLAALAAGADLAAFRQVVALVMRGEADWLVWLLVFGFTAAALTLAHFAGRLWRGARAGEQVATPLVVHACVGLWLALGAAAFVIRLLVRYDSGATDQFQLDQTQVGQSVATSTVLSSALLFLALYLAAGTVALVGAYLTHNPLATAYQRALRAHRRAVRRLERSGPPYERARHVLAEHLADRQRDHAGRQAARDERFALADELKRYAEVLIASQLQDPSATDGVTRPDRRPWAQDEKPDNPPEPRT